MRQVNGYKFRRQRPIGPYVVDFVCLEQKLVVDLDGGQHAEQKAYDGRRDAWLMGQGFEVVRFWDNDVLTNIDSVKEAIFCALIGPPPVSSPEAGEDRE